VGAFCGTWSSAGASSNPAPGRPPPGGGDPGPTVNQESGKCRLREAAIHYLEQGMSLREICGSVERVRAALLASGHPDTVIQFPAGTRTAAEAAAAVGCTVGQIAKSIVFRCGARPVVVITSGANRVDPARVEAALGIELGRADAEWVRQTTGFAIGGVAPVGHLNPPMMLLDEDLLALDRIWAAAGSPNHVFRTTASELMRITDAKAVLVKAA
jgi:prolyl-tRNA editing enzyme YbaK/EbsC (Cys-tRNA(Pro) deacylase)